MAGVFWRRSMTKLPVANLVVGLQEYGITNRSLVAGLEARGATVESVHVYDWALAGGLRAAGSRISAALSAGEIDVAMFTSGNQVFNLLKLADELGLAGRSAGRFSQCRRRFDRTDDERDASQRRLAGRYGAVASEDGTFGERGGGEGRGASGSQADACETESAISDCGLRIAAESARSERPQLCTTVRS